MAKAAARNPRGGARGGNRFNVRRGALRSQREDMELMAMVKQKAERRERILAKQRRVTAKWQPKIPEYRKVSFENFKNRYQDIDEPSYAIEVLVGGTGLQAQIRREHGKRRREEVARLRESYLNNVNKASEAQRAPKVVDVTDKSKRDKKSDIPAPVDGEIQRVRIQSQSILGHLTALLNDTESRATPRTFVRPFKALVYLQPKMREILATLEEKWADYEEIEEDDAQPTGTDTPDDEEPEVVEAEAEAASQNGDDEDKESEVDDDDSDNESIQSVDSTAEEDFDSVMDSPEALRDMRCYVKFIDDEVMPLYNHFNGSVADKVTFNDLWYLFRMGDLIYMPSSNEVGGRYHEVWRIYRIEVPDAETSYPQTGWEIFADDYQPENTSFRISAYYIDHDGTSYGAVRRTFDIDAFVGEMAIESLEVYPIRYRENHQQLLESLKTQGRNFHKYLEDRHQQYSAWTLTRNPPWKNTEPNEEILENENYEKMRHPEFIESDVIVDLTEAYQKVPDWRPKFHTARVNKSRRFEIEKDDMSIQHWFDTGRQTLAYSQREIVQKSDGVEILQRREALQRDNFLKYRVYGSRTFETNPKALDLREEDFVLLPKRMFAYALRERRFIAVDLNHLKPVRREAGVFEDLRIQKEYKDVVRGLVMSHFQKKVLERKYAAASQEGPSQDLIQGKGRGLVVLLHGVPGVGKTATAEAVAMENRKPLFVITCGDLGLTPDDVESSLKNVFRLAHLWDCVLLLDEADVFLSQRSKQDMKRNALVSVFLRVLEYYNGLLFLTTNRVGTIDEAFKSRIHLSLYYVSFAWAVIHGNNANQYQPPLDKTQTRDIFRLNIAKLKVIEQEGQRMTGEPALIIKERDIIDFADKHYEDLARSTGCWNGRQIRSAFQIASSLALYNYTNLAQSAREHGQQVPAAPILDRALFEKVQMSTQSFDRHMKKESGGVEMEIPRRGSFHQDY
ncbi:putative cell division cycle ATPase [Paramyrothecium foliicola]|nr:putative cell division cycle ATPase [Paramyrothecium foliicola]